MKCSMIKFSQKGDERGSLIVIESKKELPFEIKRVFYMLNTTRDTIRGQHANRESEFVLVNIKGSVKIKVHDGYQSDVYVLDQPDVGIYIPRMIWKEMYDFSEDSILLVLSDQGYLENEYLRSFDEYVKEMGNLI